MQWAGGGQVEIVLARCQHHSSDLGVLLCSDEKTDPLKMGCCCPAEEQVPLQSEFAVKKASNAAALVDLRAAQILEGWS